MKSLKEIVDITLEEIVYIQATNYIKTIADEYRERLIGRNIISQDEIFQITDVERAVWADGVGRDFTTKQNNKFIDLIIKTTDPNAKYGNYLLTGLKLSQFQFDEVLKEIYDELESQSEIYRAELKELIAEQGQLRKDLANAEKKQIESLKRKSKEVQKKKRVK